MKYINYNEFADAIIDGDAKSYCHVGNFCGDCNKLYFDCCCEGDRNSYGPCKDCGWNFCLCEYGISKLYNFKTLVRKATFKFVKQNLSKEVIKNLIEIIKERITPRDKKVQKAKTLKEIIDILNYENG